MKWTDQIKDVCKISEVVSKYCKITRQSAGKYLVKCPFHNEKTPSCTVDDARNIFYCFGCKVGGDAIRFVQMIESIDFVSACNKIAEWYGINLVKQDARPHSDAGKQITEWLSDCLKKNHNVMEYLFSRGLAEGTIDKFRLGWMGDKGGFLNFCTKNNISNDDLEDLGIKNSMLFLFENRIIFPILENDRTIGFGGRKFYKNDDRCKYINSSEARYFKKKNVLYGFRSYAKETCIVEGYLDVCMCAQNNINAVSSLGTAITPHHIELVWEKSDEVALWFDGDLAGQKAALKLAKEAFSVIKPSKILSFINSPLGEDPASFLQNKGDFAQLWNAREHLLDKVWNSENPKNQKTPEMCVAKYKTVQSYAEMIQDRELRGLYTQGFRQKWFEKRSDKTQSARTKTVATNPDPKSTYEMILLMTVFYFPEIFDEVCDYLLSMNLEGSYFHLRERLLNKTQNIIDLNTSDMLKSGEVLCTLQKLNTIAPFTLRPSTEDIVKGWMEVFSFYCDCMTSRRQNE